MKRFLTYMLAICLLLGVMPTSALAADAAGKPFPDVAASFADMGSVSPWASKEVGAVQAAGIMKGVADNRFDPKGTYTYEQSIVTMLRMYHYLNR